MGLFKNIFGGRGSDLGPADLSVLGTDIHSHFIPGIDDGSPSLEATMELIEAMIALGYKKVITTPHVMADGYKNTPEIILGGLEKVRAEITRRGLAIEIDAAAEYYLDHELDVKVQEKSVLTFGEEMVLFELPFIAEPNMLLSLIFTMQTQEYKPVLAHPERYAYWHNDFSKYEMMKERGVLLQLNIVSLSGAYGPGVKKTAERLIDEGMIDLLGSDCHNMNHIQAVHHTLSAPHLHKLLESGKLLNARL